MSIPESRRRTNSSNGRVDLVGPSPRRAGHLPQDSLPPSDTTDRSADDREETTSRAALSALGLPDLSGGWSYRDFLVPYILLGLSAQRAHGYFIEQYLRGLGLANVELSTLYRTLRQLEKNGLVNSTWEPGPEGPARRIYSLTDSGRWWLDAGAAALAGYRSIIDRFFGSYSGPSSGRADSNNRKESPDGQQ